MAFIYGTTTYAKNDSGNIIYYNTTPVYQVRLGYQVNSQDIEQNKSNITLQLEVRSVNSQYITYGYNQTTTIDGTTLSSKTFDFRSTNVWQIFGTRTFDVTHNADGTYSVEKSGSFTTTVSGTNRPKSGSASVTVALPTIPRASSITVSDANIGSSTNIVINKASSSFTTTLEYSTNNSTWNTIVTKTSNQVYGWTVPTSFYSLIPNTKTMTCYFRATTYSGDTNVGVKTTTATFTATGNPVVNSSSATDVNSTTTALTGNSANMVKYASNVQVSVNVSGQNSATVSSVTVNGSNVSLSGTNPKTGSITFNSASTNSFEIKVTDSRGYQTTTTKTMTAVNYVQLSINATIKRNQPTDGKVNISFSGNYYNGSFGSQSNTLTVQYRYKESTSASWGNWTNVTATTSGNTYSGSTQLSNMDYTKSYNFEIRATDKVGTKPITGITVTKGTPVYWWDNDEFDTTVNTKIGGTLYGKGSVYTNGKTNATDGVAGVGIQAGGIEISHATPYIDFHYNNSTSDYTSRIIEDGSGQLAFSNNIRAKTIQNMYTANSTGSVSSTVYVKLCNITFSTHTQGEFVGMKIYIGRGNNGTTDQQAYIDLAMQLGWTGSLDGRFGCTWELHSMETTFTLSNVSIIVIANSRTSYDVYLATSVSYCKPCYIVNCYKSITLTHYGTTSTTAPSGTQCNIKGLIIAPTEETGSNTNGSWIKYPDGRMTCFKTVTGTINISTGWGNSYTSADVSLGSWPQTFTAEPELQITQRRYGTNAYNYFLGGVKSVSTTSAGDISLLRFSSQNNVQYKLYIEAKGRWK